MKVARPLAVYWGLIVVLAVLAGGAMSVFFALTDAVLAPVHGLRRIPLPPFPVSLGASLTAGIGEEVLFRLFFISFCGRISRRP